MPRGIYVRKPVTEKTRKILSLSHLENTPWNKGTKLSMPKCPECFVDLKDRRSKYCRNHRPVILGRKVSEETRAKMSFSRLGTKNHNWKGGHKAMVERFKHRKNILTLRRIARKHGAVGSYSLEEWDNLKKRWDFTCLRCGRKEPEIKLTQDHIIPLIKGGSNYISNIQPLCKSCNSRKHVKIEFYPLLLETTH